MEGIRILEVAEHTFVPAASAILADWGAEVIKIEHVTRGDAARGLGSTGIAGFSGKVAVLMEHANRGKKSLGLDLTDPAGRDILYRLAAISDVFLTNKMAGVRKKLQIEVDDIRAHNPNIVYVRGTGYGNRGPDADAGGYDSLGFWARSGVAHSVTPSDLPQPLNQPGPAFGDSIGAMTIAGGISAALLHRERTGEATGGRRVAAVDGHVGDGRHHRGVAGHRHGRGRRHRPASPPRRSTRSSATSAPPTAASSCSRCCRASTTGPRSASASGGPTSSTTPASTPPSTSWRTPPPAPTSCEAEIKQYTLDEIKARLTGMRGQWAVVQDTIEIGDDPQVVANGYLQELEWDGYPYKLVATPVQFDEEPSVPGKSPDFNEHGDEILTEQLGLDWDTVIDLKVKGVVA